MLAEPSISVPAAKKSKKNQGKRPRGRKGRGRKDRGRASTLTIDFNSMPYRDQQFVNNEIYHITLKAIDDNLLFKNVDDYYRGIFSIYEFNNLNPVSIQRRREFRIRFKEGRGRASTFIDERNKLVEVLAFCFMPNHIHLLARQLKEGGITKFMSKVGTGYGGYFNRKYDRKGYVLQDRFSVVRIKNDEQLKTVFVYIHTNPISLIKPKWKEIGIKNPEETIKFVENYKWSSYSDYIGKENFPSVAERKFLLRIMGGEQGCKDFIENWIRYKREIGKFTNLALE